MRIVIGVILMLAALGTREASACKHKGKVLLKVTQTPLAGQTDKVPDAQMVIYANGAWGWVQEMPEGEEPASQGGCMNAAHLKELKRAVARAKFENGAPETCDAVAERSIEYAAPGRKKKVTMTTPCGDTLDKTTQALASCAELVERDGHLPSKEVRAACRGQRYQP